MYLHKKNFVHMYIIEYFGHVLTSLDKFGQGWTSLDKFKIIQYHYDYQYEKFNNLVKPFVA